MIVILYTVAATVAVASFYLFLADAYRMAPGVQFSVITPALLLLWFVLCRMERKRQRQLQRLREGLDRLR